LSNPTPGIQLSRLRVQEFWVWLFKEGINPLKKDRGVAVNSADFPVDTRKGSLIMIIKDEP
ncbi:MAG: hypothetical protein ACKPKO_45090, partial [Candidatus Fonsibacter sp.]